jgi:hypothetical protein
LRGTEHVLFSNNSLVQISKSFSSCGLEIFATSQGLYLSENIIASNFSSETEDLNLEHHLMISDFDKKIFYQSPVLTSEEDSLRSVGLITSLQSEVNYNEVQLYSLKMFVDRPDLLRQTL